MCVFLRHEKREGWAGFLPIYLVKCSAHGLYEQYPQGYRENLPCPKCFEETIMGVKIK